jgi:hypothetical protein
VAEEEEAATMDVAADLIHVVVRTVTMTTMMVIRDVLLRRVGTSDDRIGHSVKVVEKTQRGSKDHLPPHAEKRDVVEVGVEVVEGGVEVEDHLEEEDQDHRTVEIIIETRSQRVKVDHQGVDQTRVMQRVRLVSNRLTSQQQSQP